MSWLILNHLSLTCSNDLPASNTSCPCLLRMCLTYNVLCPQNGQTHVKNLAVFPARLLMRV